jgi:hypothetical protein
VPPFDKTLEATLTAAGDQTILVIEVKGMPLDKIAFFGAGWQIHAENLAAHIAGGEPGDTEAQAQPRAPCISFGAILVDARGADRAEDGPRATVDQWLLQFSTRAAAM